jgi:CRISPR-associated protein Cmr2
MAEHYLTLSVGPVQPFIAAARRSHDLWCGSWLLSEVAKAAALALVEGGGDLILPAARRADLAPNSPFQATNKIVAVVKDDPATVAEVAKGAACRRWREIAEEARLQAVRLAGEGAIRADQWTAQVDDVLELFAAWAVIGDGGYGAARDAAEALLRARKATRDFAPTPTEPDGYGLLKSSLDGARETLLADLSDGQRRKLGLSAGEQLDCPGLVKRLAGPAEQFTPLSRIALDPWLRGIEAAGAAGALKAVCAALEPLVGGEISRVCGNEGIYKSLPYDAQLLYRGRLEAFGREGQVEAGQVAAIRCAAQPLWGRFGESTPYLALLRADGDRMGRLFDAMATGKEQRHLSNALSTFAAAVAQVVRDYRGHCLYAGGDDILALLPLDRALACARDLHDRFGETLAPVAVAAHQPAPTLSVGLVVGHFLTPLSRLLRLTHEAERLAKGEGHPQEEQRDGLGVILSPRSGGPLCFRDRWEHAPDARLARWVAAHRADDLPGRCAYQLREIARQVAGIDAGMREQIEKAELVRILGRKRGGDGIDVPLAGEMVAALQHRGLAGLAEEVILIRRLAEAADQADGVAGRRVREAAHG